MNSLAELTIEEYRKAYRTFWNSPVNIENDNRLISICTGIERVLTNVFSISDAYIANIRFEIQIESRLDG